MTRNHGGGIIGREIIEKESLRGEASRRHLGGIWSRRYLGGIWRHLGGIWKHLGGIWEASGGIWGGMGDHGRPRGVNEGKSAKSIVFYRVRGRGRPFRRRVAKATWLGPRFLSATLGVRMRGRGREHPPGRIHGPLKPTARNPTVQGTVWVIKPHFSPKTS